MFYHTAATMMLIPLAVPRHEAICLATNALPPPGVEGVEEIRTGLHFCGSRATVRACRLSLHGLYPSLSADLSSIWHPRRMPVEYHSDPRRYAHEATGHRREPGRVQGGYFPRRPGTPAAGRVPGWRANHLHLHQPSRTTADSAATRSSLAGAHNFRGGTDVNGDPLLPIVVRQELLGGNVAHMFALTGVDQQH